MDEVRTPSNSKYYTPSSESFSIYYLVNDELEKFWKQAFDAQERYIHCTGICLEGLMKYTRNINQVANIPAKQLSNTSVNATSTRSALIRVK
jgi:hypothetical protein